MRLYNRLWALAAGAGLIVISYHDVLLQAFVDAREKGMTLGIIVPIWIFINKVYKGRKFEERDRRWEGKLNAIMKAVGAEIAGPQKILQKAQTSSNASPRLSWAAIYREIFRSKGTKRMEQIRWATLIPAVFGAVKLILQPFGIDLAGVTDDNVNDIANGVAALATVIGILMSHRKPAAKGPQTIVKIGGETNEYAQPTPPVQSAK